MSKVHKQTKPTTVRTYISTLSGDHRELLGTKGMSGEQVREGYDWDLNWYTE